MNMTLYQNQSERKKLRKTLVTKKEVPVFHIKEPTSIINPAMQIKVSDLPEEWSVINYAYVPQLRRYYFVDDIIMESAGLVTFKMTVDPLQTYQEKLLQSTFEIARSESVNSKKFIDPQKVLQCQRQVSFVHIGYFPEDSTGKKYVITTTGGT